jgi:hypothetical protein
MMAAATRPACEPGRLNFQLHRNSELGLEKDYVSYMSQGLSVEEAYAREIGADQVLARVNAVK